MHRDGPIVTASVALNAPDEYGGGGTLIEAVGRAGRDAGAQGAADPCDAIRPGSGCVVLHPNLNFDPNPKPNPNPYPNPNPNPNPNQVRRAAPG